MIGEGLLNDAVAIQLYVTISNYDIRNPNTITWGSLLPIFGEFLKYLAYSLLMGVLFGFVISYITRKMRFIVKNVIIESLIIMVFALASYYIGMVTMWTGAVTLLINSIMMAHYAWHNLSPQGKHVSSATFQAIGFGAEAVIFCFVGLTAATITQNNVVNWTFIGYELLVILISRFVSVFLLHLLSLLMPKYR